jgi:hypothetical protein
LFSLVSASRWNILAALVTFSAEDLKHRLKPLAVDTLSVAVESFLAAQSLAAETASAPVARR